MHSVTVVMPIRGSGMGGGGGQVFGMTVHHSFRLMSEKRPPKKSFLRGFAFNSLVISLCYKAIKATRSMQFGRDMTYSRLIA